MADPVLALDLRSDAPLPDDLAARRDAATERFGFTPNLFAGYAHAPQRLRNFLAMRDELMTSPSALTPIEREMIAVVVSALNRCHYCSVSHGAALRHLTGDPALADTLAINHAAAALEPRARAMLAFAAALTQHPERVGEAERAALRVAGFGEAEIWDIAEITAFFNMTNRFATAIGLQPNAEFHALGR